MAEKCPQADSFCNSDLKHMKTSFLWSINNFSECPEKTGECLQSLTFSAKDDTSKWCLDLYPNGVKEEDKEFLSIFLNLKTSDKTEVNTKYNFAIIDCNQQIYRQLDPIRHRFKKGDNNWGYKRFIKRSNLMDDSEELLPNDRLTLYCEVICFERQTISGQPFEVRTPHKELVDDMRTLYENLSDCDVDIVVKGHKFSGHKVILKARCPVFAAMFEHPMKENLQNKVFIEDIDKEVFDRLLRFIYTDKVDKQTIDSDKKLLSAADKYNLNDLKSICEEYIGSELSVETVCDVLILADNHLAENLKTKAIDLIKCNFTKVVLTKGWKQIIDRSDVMDCSWLDWWSDRSSDASPKLEKRANKWNVFFKSV